MTTLATTTSLMRTKSMTFDVDTVWPTSNVERRLSTFQKFRRRNEKKNSRRESRCRDPSKLVKKKNGTSN
jgi:hypothetical protein